MKPAMKPANILDDLPASSIPPSLRAKFVAMRASAKRYHLDYATAQRMAGLVGDTLEPELGDLLEENRIAQIRAEADRILIARSPRPFPATAVIVDVPPALANDTFPLHRVSCLLSDGHATFLVTRDANAKNPVDGYFAAEIGGVAFDAWGEQITAPHFDGESVQIRHIKGILRHIELMLFFLLAQAPDVIAMEHVATRRTVSKGKPRRIAAHSVVRLSAEKSVLRRAAQSVAVVQAEARAPVRAHDVRRHYRHLNLRAGCGCRTDHTAWEAVETDPAGWVRRAVCRRCGGLRVSVSPHRRGTGDAVSVPYQVVART